MSNGVGWHMRHSAPLSKPVGSALFTIGGGYGWGSKVDDQLTALLQNENRDLEAKYVYRSFRVLFGFEIGVD